LGVVTINLEGRVDFFRKFYFQINESLSNQPTEASSSEAGSTVPNSKKKKIIHVSKERKNTLTFEKVS
jgi:hypothetical protein